MTFFVRVGNGPAEALGGASIWTQACWEQYPEQTITGQAMYVVGTPDNTDWYLIHFEISSGNASSTFNDIFQHSSNTFWHSSSPTNLLKLMMSDLSNFSNFSSLSPSVWSAVCSLRRLLSFLLCYNGFMTSWCKNISDVTSKEHVNAKSSKL